MKKPSYLIKDVELSTLVELPTANPNSLPAAQFEALKLSIQENGFLQPLLVWERDGEMVLCDGFHRSTAMMELGYTYAPAVVMRGTEDQIRLLRISMNRTRGQLDYSIMSEELKDIIEGEEYSIDDLGWTALSDSEIQALTADVDELDDITAKPIELLPQDDGNYKAPSIRFEFATETDKAKVLDYLTSVYAGDKGHALMLALGLAE